MGNSDHQIVNTDVDYMVKFTNEHHVYHIAIPYSSPDWDVFLRAMCFSELFFHP